MTRIKAFGAAFLLIVGVWEVVAAPPPPPPPPGGGGGIKPPDAPPPGKIYFEDNVVIVGPGFVKPDSDGGTVYVDLSTLTPGKTPDGRATDKAVETIVREVESVKSQVEALSVAIPQGLLDPASLLQSLMAEPKPGEKGIFDDPAFLSEEAGGPEPASLGRAGEARAGSAAVRADPGMPAPAQLKRRAAEAAVIPSYWQLPIR
jgi:hypothetical protein